MRSLQPSGRLLRGSLLGLALLLVASACGGSEESPDESTVATAPAGDAVNGLDNVRSGVIRIEAKGSFDYPGEGTSYNEGFTGSGFFISPDGIAVTNNHVVTGAAFLQVYVEGETEPRNAKILGVSECSDLAVIDVDGDDFPFLAWRDESSPVGTTVYAAGFPLGNTEYTLLDGIVSKESVGGESNWASVDSVIEHTADILPGNSGGPLVDEDGRVVGVNYAGDDNGQTFAIGYTEASKVIPTLQGGNDVTSIGINGSVISDEDSSGIWVHSVASGSPADLVGVRGGDIVSEISGIIPGVDGTMSDYCDVLRSHDADEAIQIEVYRPDADVYMEGTLNTDKILAPIGTPAPDTATDSTQGTSAPDTVSYLEIGECITAEELNVYTSGADAQTVPCDQPHYAELFHTVVFSDAVYPGVDALLDQLNNLCVDAFPDYVARDYESSALGVFGIVPEQESWDANERVGECLLADVAEQDLIGSAYQSGW